MKRKGAVQYAGIPQPRWLLSVDCPDCGMAAGQPCAAIPHHPRTPLPPEVRAAFARGRRVHSGRARSAQRGLDVLALLAEADSDSSTGLA